MGGSAGRTHRPESSQRRPDARGVLHARRFRKLQAVPEAKPEDWELAILTYCEIMQFFEDGRISVPVARKALALAESECFDQAVESRLSWAPETGTSDFTRNTDDMELPTDVESLLDVDKC